LLLSEYKNFFIFNTCRFPFSQRTPLRALADFEYLVCRIFLEFRLQ